MRVVHPGSRIWILTFYPSRISDPGVKKASDPRSVSAILIFSYKHNGLFLLFFVRLREELVDVPTVHDF
jgi:hypothetical protein